MTELRSHFGSAPDYAGPGTGSVLVEVKSGDTSLQIGAELKAKGVVESVDAFNNAAKADDRSRNIQVGFYQLKKQMKASDALALLVNPKNLMQALVVVPEGARVRSIVATIVAKTDITRRALTQALAHPSTIGLPAEAKGNPEGFLFPATYSVPPDQTAVGLLRQMVAKTVAVDKALDLPAKAQALGYTPDQILTVASILEYEADRGVDYPKVARVIYNRLQQHIPLQLGLHGRLRQRPRRRRVDHRRRARQQLPLQHLRAPGPAPRADRLAGRADDPGRAEPGGRRLAVLPARLPAPHHALLRPRRPPAPGRPGQDQGLLPDHDPVLRRSR